MQIVPIACLRDNYAYLLVDPNTNSALVVDPSEAEPIRSKIVELGVKLHAILNTHHHHDHIGGNKELISEIPDLDVFGHTGDKGRIPGQTCFLEDKEVVEKGAFSFQALHTSGHTRGAISYYFANENAVFTGDTLFTAGCGRLFEGTPAQLNQSLAKLGALAKHTEVFCGHEYTVNNLAFATAVEPASQAVKARMKGAQAMREKGLPTIPSTMELELETNPFMRVSKKTVVEAAENQTGRALTNPSEVFGALRSWKDSF